MARVCDFCGGDHMTGFCEGSVAENSDGGPHGDGPIAFGVDPYEMLNPSPQTQASLRQLELAEQTRKNAERQAELLDKLIALTAAQGEEVKALRGELAQMRRLGPGGGGRALPGPRFCSFCGGPLKACTPRCRVHGNEQE